MNMNEIPTQFLPAEKSNDAEVRRQVLLFAKLPFFQDVIDAVSDFVLILNSNRQIVLSNRQVHEQYERSSNRLIRGLRLGELMECIHAFESPGGCGTTEFCKTCGAANAIVNTSTIGQNIQECRIYRTANKGALDLRVKATPIQVEGENFTLFVITDISHEKRRRSLERIFFHDILNLAGNVRNLCELITSGFPERREQYIQLLQASCDMLINEIKAQKDLTAAENNELHVNIREIDSLKLLESLVNIYTHHKVAGAKTITIDNRSESILFQSDWTLLSRVLGNMLKNALESTSKEGVVTIGCRSKDDGVEFWVHNEEVMSKETRLQIFQRSFSTKAPDRGLGTYSMKLLGEKYLGGSISFDSNKKNGTVFRAYFPKQIKRGEK